MGVSVQLSELHRSETGIPPGDISRRLRPNPPTLCERAFLTRPLSLPSLSSRPLAHSAATATVLSPTLRLITWRGSLEIQVRFSEPKNCQHNSPGGGAIGGSFFSWRKRPPCLLNVSRNPLETPALHFLLSKKRSKNARPLLIVNKKFTPRTRLALCGPFPGTIAGPLEQSYCRVLEGGIFL